MSKKNKITKVWIEHRTDENPDSSYLGDYSKTPKGNAIDRKERGDMGRNEFQYFNPAQHHNGWSGWSGFEDVEVLKAYNKMKFGSEVGGGHHETSRSAMCEALNASYREQDYERAEALNRGDWQFIGIIAKCEVVTGNGTVQTLRSGGLWGVESDSSPEYLDSIAKDELASLRDELESFGFSARQIDYAFKSVQTINK